MSTRLLCLSLAACLVPSFSAFPARAQEPTEARPAFDVASVKRSSPLDDDLLLPTPGTARPNGRWFARRMPLSLILQSLHGLRREQVVGGPSWIDEERFDIEARAPAGTSAEQTRLMVETLLADRFHLRTHTEERRISVYALVLARQDGRFSPGLRRTASDCSGPDASRGADGLSVCGGISVRVVDGVRQLRLRGYPLREFPRMALASAVLGSTAVDRTGLTGYFDIDVDYVVPSSLGGLDDPSVSGPSLVEAVETRSVTSAHVPRRPNSESGVRCGR
jgi:uncharacterized protein (TIGR03435 family)